MFITSHGGGSSDCTQIMCADPIFKPFIGSGLGRAKTPWSLFKRTFTYVVIGEIGRDRHQMVSAPQLWKRFFFV
jgi:hypothetical protein